MRVVQAVVFHAVMKVDICRGSTRRLDGRTIVARAATTGGGNERAERKGDDR